jgi:hypothetical protein
MPDLNDDQIAEINKYADAFRQEFLEAVEATSEDAKIDPGIKDVREELDDMLPGALGAIKHILKHSKNEALKGSTARWLIDKKLDSEKNANDPLNRFLEELKGLPTTKQASEASQ